MAETHSFDIDVAQVVGVNAAIILGSIYHWCKKNRLNDKHYHDGYYWTYNSVKAFSEIYPYLGRSAIDTALRKLEDGGYIIVGNYNQTQYDRTRWYAITEAGISLFYPEEKLNSEIHFRKSEMEEQKIGNGSTGNQQPIPFIDSCLTSSSNMDSKKKRRRTPKPFVPPTLEEVEAYVHEKGYNIDPRYFIDYYESMNWHQSNGKPVKDWKRCCVTWHHNSYGSGQKSRRRKYDYSEYNPE